MMIVNDEPIEDFVIENYKNLYYSNEIGCHEGSYAINIKEYSFPRNIRDESEANFLYEYISTSFFDLVEIVSLEFGYAGFTVEGRSGGWLKPIRQVGDEFRTIKVPQTEHLDFHDHIAQEKFWQYSQVIENLKNQLRVIMVYSQTVEQAIQKVTRLIENEQ